MSQRARGNRKQSADSEGETSDSEDFEAEGGSEIDGADNGTRRSPCVFLLDGWACRDFSRALNQQEAMPRHRLTRVPVATGTESDSDGDGVSGSGSGSDSDDGMDRNDANSSEREVGWKEACQVRPPAHMSRSHIWRLGFSKIAELRQSSLGRPRAARC